MKAIAHTRRGLELQRVPRPTPKRHELLIRIHATTTAASGPQAGLSAAPVNATLLGRIPGQDLAGEVVAIGRGVTRFRKGDQVIAWSGLRLGTHAEYICLPEKGVVFIKPPSMTYVEAASVPVAGLDTANLLRRANIRPGEKILINGAGGNMGTYAVQIAKQFGAEVTSVDSAEKLDMLRAIGSDHVVDYKREAFIQNGKSYDLIFDVIGNHSLSTIMERLNSHGRYLTAVPRVSRILRWLMTARRDGKKILFWAPRIGSGYAEDFAFLLRLIEGGAVRAIIDRSFALEQAAEAVRYVEGGHKKGHVVITVPPWAERYQVSVPQTGDGMTIA